MKLGYIRVSTEEQNEARQTEALQKAGVDKIYLDKKSGKNTDRPQLQTLLDTVRSNDQVIVLTFDRLARNAKDLLCIVEFLEQKGATLHSITEGIDTSNHVGKLMLTILGGVAEMERKNILERQQQGIAIAKREGRYLGRKPKILDEWKQIYKEWEENKLSASRAAKLLGISKSTFYRRVDIEKNDPIIDF